MCIGGPTQYKRATLRHRRVVRKRNRPHDFSAAPPLSTHVAEWGSKFESGQARGQPGRAHGQAAMHEENVGAKGAMGLRAP